MQSQSNQVKIKQIHTVNTSICKNQKKPKQKNQLIFTIT